MNPGINADDKSNNDENEDYDNEADVKNNNSILDDEDGGIIMNYGPI